MSVPRLSLPNVRMLQRAGRWMADSTSCPWLLKPQAQVYGLIAGSGSWKAAGLSQEKLFFQLGSAWLRMRGSAGCSPGLCLAFPLVSDVPWEQVGAHQPPGIKSVLPAKGILQPGGRDDFLVAKPPAGNSPRALCSPSWGSEPQLTLARLLESLSAAQMDRMGINHPHSLPPILPDPPGTRPSHSNQDSALFRCRCCHEPFNLTGKVDLKGKCTVIIQLWLNQAPSMHFMTE